MALVASIHINTGWNMPNMALHNTQGETVHIQDFMGKNGLLLAFTCNHCPYAIAVWPRLMRHAKTLQDMGINTIAINPNIHPDFPEDSIPAMKNKIQEWGIDFPYLADESQEVARAFDAQCTPDLYLFNDHAALYYHGRMDDYWKDESKVTQEELMPAAQSLLQKAPAPKIQHPTIGCSIKWKIS